MTAGHFSSQDLHATPDMKAEKQQHIAATTSMTTLVMVSATTTTSASTLMKTDCHSSRNAPGGAVVCAADAFSLLDKTAFAVGSGRKQSTWSDNERRYRKSHEDYDAFHGRLDEHLFFYQKLHPTIC